MSSSIINSSSFTNIHYRDGKSVDRSWARDRGLLYGDGVFTTLKWHKGTFVHQKAHWQRLSHDAEKLFIKPIDFNTFVQYLEQAVISLPEEAAIVRVTLTRGNGRGYSPDKDANSHAYVSAMPFTDWPESLSISLCCTRLSRNPGLAGLKHCNRLEQILAAAELSVQFDEGLVLDTEEFVVEGTMSNVIWYHSNQFFTPSICFSGVNGLAKCLLVEKLTQNNFKVEQSEFKIEHLLKADGIWMCNSVRGVRAITSLMTDKPHQFPIHHHTKLLLQLFIENN